MRRGNENLYNDYVLYGRPAFGYRAAGIGLAGDLLNWDGAFDTSIR